MNQKQWVLILVILILSSTSIQAQEKIFRNATVAVIPPAMTSPFHGAIVDGAIAVGDDFGWEVISRAPNRETDFEGQVTIVEQVVQQEVDAIAINPISSNAIITAVMMANDSGIPIFMYNTITPIAEGAVVEYIGYDQWGGAAKLAIYVCELLAEQNGVAELDATGQVFILTGIPGFHTNRRTGGFRWGLARTCPNVEVVGEQTAEWERENSLQVAITALQRRPDIDVFFGNSDEMAIGACLAASQQGLTINQDIFCVGIDGNSVTLDLISEDEMTATLGVYPERMGGLVLEQMNKYLLGEDIPEFLLTPSIIVDHNNLDEYISGDTWTEPVTGLPETDNELPTIPIDE